jgi:hypothetical protein
MAKAKDTPALDQETIDMLDMDVKKKKPRKFFLVFKGAQIKTLVVFKKGPFGPKIMAAKKAGHIGDICYGIVTGSGEKLNFQLPGNAEVAAAMKVDSWEPEPPMEPVKLKKFMKESGHPCKPSFEMVTDASSISDPESDDVGPASGPATSVDPMVAFVARREPLEARLLEAKRADPDKATKLGAVWDYAGEQATAGAFDKATTALDRLEKALDEILAAPAKTDAERFGIEEGLVAVTRDKLVAAFEKSKLVWERTRGSIQKELQKLEKSILDQSQEEEDYEVIQANSDNVYVALDELDDELIEVLEQALEADDDKMQAEYHARARQVVQRYRDFLSADDFLSEVDDNPFTTIKVNSTLEASLAALDNSLRLTLVAS